MILRQSLTSLPPLLLISISSFDKLILLTGAVSATLNSHIGDKARSGFAGAGVGVGAATLGAAAATSTCLGFAGSLTPLDLSSNKRISSWSLTRVSLANELDSWLVGSDWETHKLVEFEGLLHHI